MSAAAVVDPLSLSSLQSLAARGQWLTILETISTARSSSSLSLSPHQHLTFLTFSSLSLFKLRRFPEALSLLPDPLPSSSPFALRWLLAVLPSKLGDRAETLDRLYHLLDFARDTKLSKHCHGGINGVWERREGFVVGTIVSLHLGNKEFGVALALVEGLVKGGNNDPVLLSKLGYIQMQIGDLEGAKATFCKIEELVEDKLGEVGVRNLVGRNKALGYLVGKDYSSAVREYEACIERDGADVVAVNNKAICLMYLRELSGSITVLEGALERVPTVALNEPLVVNLCSMYELAYVNHLDNKKTLSKWISQVAPDDFDTSCTRI